MKTAQKRIPLFAYFILTIAGLVGILGLCSGTIELFRSMQCENWPQTEGVIQSAELTHHSNKHEIYGEKISDTYQVANIAYSSERVSFGELETAEQAHAKAILDRFPVGKQVAVFYSTANPASAVLETGVHGQTWVTLSVAALFLILVTVLYIGIHKQTNREKELPVGS